MKLTKKIMIMLISVCLFSQNIFAQTNTQLKQDNGIELCSLINSEGDTVTIKFKQLNNGDQVYTQYINDNLDVTNTVKFNDSNTIYSVKHSSNRNYVPKTEIIKANQYIEENKSFIKYISPRISEQRKYLGKVKFSTFDPGYEYIYGVNTYSECVRMVKNTYDINGFVGEFVTICTILASAIALPKALTAKFLSRALSSAGITVVSGKITEAFTTTVQSDNYHYNMYTYDINNNHCETLQGVKYYVTDTEYTQYTGETYYEGFVPQQWGKQVQAIALQDRLYGFRYYNVLGWY